MNSTKISFKREGLLEDGEYRLRIDDVERKTSQAGNEMLNLKFSVIVNGQPRGGSIWSNIMLTPQSRWVMEQFLDSVGAPNTDDEVSPQWFKGKFCWAQIKTGEWKGKLRNEIDYYVVPEASELLADDDDEEEEDAPTPIKRPNPASRPVAQPARSGKKAAPVAEMEEEDFPV